MSVARVITCENGLSTFVANRSDGTNDRFGFGVVVEVVVIVVLESEPVLVPEIPFFFLTSFLIIFFLTVTFLPFRISVVVTYSIVSPRLLPGMHDDGEDNNDEEVDGKAENKEGDDAINDDDDGDVC